MQGTIIANRTPIRALVAWVDFDRNGPTGDSGHITVPVIGWRILSDSVEPIVPMHIEQNMAVALLDDVGLIGVNGLTFYADEEEAADDLQNTIRKRHRNAA